MVERRFADCPECGGRVELFYSEYMGRDYFVCGPCATRRRAERERIRRAVTAVLPQLASPLGQRLVHRFVALYGIDALARLRSVTDDDFLAIGGLGPTMLALLRGVVPTPVPTAPPWLTDPDVAAYAAEVG